MVIPLISRVMYVCYMPHQTRDWANRPITVQWDFKLEEAPDSYEIKYSPYSDYKNAITETLDANVTSYNLFNLYKGTNYYFSVTYVKGSSKATIETTFRTTDLGPRVMSVDGIYNVRDIGGYVTESGKTTVQGLIYRGGSLRPYKNYDSLLTDEGEELMQELLGIKTDLDVRGWGEESEYLDR